MKGRLARPVRPIRRLLSLLVILLVSATSASALDPNKALTQYTRRVWTTREGLPLAAIFSIAQTRDGYLWVGTHEGLARFDGITFTVFNRRNTPALTNNRITALCAAPDGALWIGTGGDRFFSSGGVRGGGIFRYAQGQWQSFSMANGLPDDIINALTLDTAGTLWIGTAGGLVAFDGQRFTHYATRDGLPNLHVAALLPDRRGGLWVGTRDGLAYLQNGQLETVGLRNHTVQALHEDPSGRFWVGTQTQLFCRRSPGEDFTPSPVPGPISDIQTDRDGNVWITSYNYGVARIHGETVERFTSPPQPGLDVAPFGVHKQSLCLLTGREGELWIGTGRGLYCFQDGAITPIGEMEGLLGRYAYPILCDTYPILRDRADAIWVGTGEGGLSRIEQGKVVAAWNKRQGLPADDVLALCEDHAGTLWIGSSAGLTRKTGDRFTTYGPADGLTGTPVRVIHEEPDGSLWLGAGTTLCRFADGTFKALGPADGYPVPDAQVLAIARDRDGVLWIGTNRGLVRRQGQTFTLLGQADGLPHPSAKYFHQDADGTLWIGTAGGLARFTNGRFTALTTRHGLFDDNIHAIFADAQGRFWMSSNLGIFAVPRAELIACADGRQPRVNCRVFGVLDGMRDAEANGSRQPAGCQAPDGSLWFPTANGIAVIQPAKLPYNAIPPPILIEGLTADGAPPATADGTLSVNTQTVEIRYTAPSFLVPERLTFSYRLLGLNQTWQSAGARRVVYFTGLAPGRYTFQVQAFNNDGVASLAPAEVSFSIPAPWHKTYLAYAVYGLLALGLVFGGVRWRLAALRRLALRLEQTVAARTAEMYRQQDALRQQRDEIERKNAEILDGLNYAKQIQEALLPRLDQLTAALPNTFVVYAPRNIVSGDFYWLRELDDNTILVAVGDCTGHGVAGALLSMIGMTLLNQVIQEGNTEPAQVLERLHLGIRHALQQDAGLKTAQDGMDIGLCRIERAHGRIKFSGARFRLHLVTPTGDLLTTKGDVKSIGGRQREAYRTFTQHDVSYANGAMLYLLTDGLTDQKGPTGERYGSRRVGALLQRLANLPPADQAKRIVEAITAFRGDEAQLDDVTVVGMRLG
ncbi:MAG: two-component regulator propeller domain-containing protein [Chloracidobacterium sp.]